MLDSCSSCGCRPPSPPSAPHDVAELARTWIKAAPTGAASGARRAGLCLGRPAQRARAVPHQAVPIRLLIWQRSGGCRLPRLRLSGSRPPRPGRPCGPSHAIGSADPGSGSHSPCIGAYEEDGEILGMAAMTLPIIRNPLRPYWLRGLLVKHAPLTSVIEPN